MLHKWAQINKACCTSLRAHTTAASHLSTASPLRDQTRHGTHTKKSCSIYVKKWINWLYCIPPVWTHESCCMTNMGQYDSSTVSPLCPPCVNTLVNIWVMLPPCVNTSVIFHMCNMTWILAYVHIWKNSSHVVHMQELKEFCCTC